ncbi:unnamed protein product [Schistosoma margrebowiei]|uniref:CCDC66 domain-containing protein n=1 Tax=Schistosoma margrebowiei TaxID=48269 RepID=A0AA85AA40_9TREM|nr:unnamed protein product [Schistosoma margrebowiei]
MKCSNQSHTVPHSTTQPSPNQQWIVNQENKIIQLVQNINKKIKNAESERDLILRIIAHLQTQEGLATDSNKYSSHESYPVNRIKSLYAENMGKQNSCEKVEHNDKNDLCKLGNLSEGIHSKCVRCNNAPNNSKQSRRNSNPVSPPEKCDAVELHNIEKFINVVLIRKLQTLADHCRKSLQTCLYLHQNGSLNPAHQPETPTWTNVPNFFPRGCACINSSINDGLLIRNSNRDTTATTLYKVEEPVKDEHSCKTLLNNSIPMNPTFNSKSQNYQAIERGTNAKPCKKILNTNKLTFTSNKYCSGKCYHCKENQLRTPVIREVIDHTAPMRKIEWR